MRVIVSRSGGIAGIRMSWQVRIEDQPDASDWFVLIRALPWDEVRPAPVSPDRFLYRIRLEQPDAAAQKVGEPAPALEEPDFPAEREATLAEQQLDGPWRELVDRVRAADRPTSSRKAGGAF
ncbi:MAG: protealysin inhibitor emfourin [Leifsonia sp.]